MSLFGNLGAGGKDGDKKSPFGPALTGQSNPFGGSGTNTDSKPFGAGGASLFGGGASTGATPASQPATTGFNFGPPTTSGATGGGTTTPSLFGAAPASTGPPTFNFGTTACMFFS